MQIKPLFYSHLFLCWRVFEVITTSDSTSVRTPSHPTNAHPHHSSPNGALNTQTHAQLRDFCFFSCFCRPQPVASSDRKPQFPLLLLWASHFFSLFFFIPLFFAFVSLSTSTGVFRLCVCLALHHLLSHSSLAKNSPLLPGFYHYIKSVCCIHTFKKKQLTDEGRQ